MTVFTLTVNVLLFYLFYYIYFIYCIYIYIFIICVSALEYSLSSPSVISWNVKVYWLAFFLMFMRSWFETLINSCLQDSNFISILSGCMT